MGIVGLMGLLCLVRLVGCESCGSIGPSKIDGSFGLVGLLMGQVE